MIISQAIIHRFNYHCTFIVTIDDYEFWTHTKYTILEIGFATYHLEEISNSKATKWIFANGETIPRDESSGRMELSFTDSMLITSNPILFALSYKFWWHLNGENLPENAPLIIPTYEEAIKIQRNRKILNDFNEKYLGTLPNQRYAKNNYEKQ